MKKSVNIYELATFDYAIANFSGTSTKPVGSSDPGVHKCFNPETGKDITLEIGRSYSVSIGDCFIKHLDHINPDVLQALSQLVCPLLATSLNDLNDDADDEEEDDEEDDDEEIDYQIASYSISASIEAMLQALRLVHRDASDVNFEDPTTCKHMLHIFTISTTDEDLDFEYHIGLIASRNADTDETRMSLVFRQTAFPLGLTSNGNYMLLSSPPELNESNIKLLLSLIAHNLPADLLEKSALDTLLIGFTDIDVDVESNITIRCLDSIPPDVTPYTDYTREKGLSLVYGRTLEIVDPEDEDEEAEELTLISVVTPMSDKIQFPDYESISEENTNRVLIAALKGIGVSLNLGKSGENILH